MHLHIDHMTVTGVDGDFKAAGVVGTPVMNAVFPMGLGENEIIGLGGAGVWHMNIPNPIGWMADYVPWPF